ncbi:MAG TPA: response regulator [Alphaproteobacteria bacterium]|nr:response regulator [Alphaproteobacteria bacterium]USO04868.1 MAG: response regulator [Rhodospirillales bacterium]HOO81868.1 response regulator [Alphaproteobacteria bacterium]
MTESAKILVVEDNDFVRMQIAKFLQDEGYEVIEGTDGSDALEKMAPDVAMAIVDVRMEPIDGFEFIKTLRSEDNETPVVLVTGDQNPDLLAEAGKWHVAAVLMKPVQRDRLVKTVSRTLQSLSRASAQ